MKVIKALYIATFALVGCSDKDALMESGKSVPIEVSADIDGGSTRVSGTSWQTDDAIGITGGSYSNVKYTYIGDSFTPAATGSDIYVGVQETDYTAYYPYSEGVKYQEKITKETRDQSGQKNFDFLYAKAKASVSDWRASFTFSHKMTKLVLKFKTDTESGFAANVLEKAGYKLSGIKLSGSFDTAKGVATATSTVTNDWEITAAAETNNGLRTYSMIFFPQEDAALTVKVTIGGQEYSCKFSPELSAGKADTYEITVKKTGLVVSKWTIGKWTEGTSITGTAAYITTPFNGHNAILMREASETMPALYIADRNVGAESPEDPGMYFWWGDTEGVYYDETNTAFLDKDRNILTFNGSELTGDVIKSYFNSSNSLITTFNKSLTELYNDGFLTSDVAWTENTDNSNAGKLKSEYDAATKYMGACWHMMTADDIAWLTAEDENYNFKNCTFTKKEKDGNVVGITVKSNSTSNEVYFPYAGYFDNRGLEDSTRRGYYWGATPKDNKNDAYYLYFANSGNNISSYIRSNNRYYGMPIRAVANNP